MSPERLRKLLESYGSRESNWPAELREDMRAGLQRSLQLESSPELANSPERANSPEPGRESELGAALREACELDDLLDSYVPSGARLEPRILAALPRPALERLLAWLAPQRGVDLWRPALAAALPLLVGVTIGLNGIMLPGNATDIDWAVQEQNLLAPPAGAVWDE